jgi:hypothetical protein
MEPNEPPIYRRFLLTKGSVVISERGPMKPSEATTHAIFKFQSALGEKVP